MGIRPDHRPRRWLRPPPSLRPLPSLHLRRRAGTLVAAAAAGTLAVPTLAACAAAPASSFSSPASSATVRAPLPGRGHPGWLVSRSVLAQLVKDPDAVNRWEERRAG